MPSPICPYCRKSVETFDEPDEKLRLYCCKCGILITIEDLTELDIKEICQGSDMDDDSSGE